MALFGIGVANSISFFRIGLAFATLALLFQTTATAYWWAFFLTIIVIWLDGLDGYLARKLGETSRIGSVIDILSDPVRGSTRRSLTALPCGTLLI